MPRSVPLSFREAADALYSDDVNLVFLVIRHRILAEPIRVVWDAKDFIYGGETFIGFPFDLKLLNDDDQAPRGSVEFQNVDSQIGLAIRTMVGAAEVEIIFGHSSDFNLAVDPRTEIGTADIAWHGKHLKLANVKCDPITVSADVVGGDNLQRVWPGIRATQDLLSALFR